MARRGDDSYDLLQNPGPRRARAETLPVRFDENPSRIPETGGHRWDSREQRYTAGSFPPRATANDENDKYYFYVYDDQHTAQLPRRTLPNPASPEAFRTYPRSPSVPSLASVEHHRANEFTYNALGHRPTSHYNAAPSPESIREFERSGDRDEYYIDMAAARHSPYYNRHAKSQSRRRSRSNSRNRYRYSRSRSSSHGRRPNLNSHDLRDGGLRFRITEVDSGLSMPEFESYSFRLSRHHNDSLQSENAQDSNSGRSEKEVALPQLQSNSSSTLQCPKIDRIIKSHYTGGGVMGGIHSVEFTVAPGQATSAARLPVPLFNQIRFEDSSMDFDSFQSGILNLDGLKGNERLAIHKLIERVKRRYDKTLQVSSRTKIRRMIPKLLQEPIHDEAPVPAFRPRKLIWLSLPYFSLEKYTSLNVKSSSHPPQTLLQTRQSMTPKERDLKQAVCHLPDTPKGSCFHIRQAWFLILDDSFIISCAGLSTAQLIKNSISIVPYRNNNPALAMRTLLVSSSGSTVWSFPLGECKTWIDFVKHFFELWPRKFEFSYNGSTITSRHWPRIFKQAERSKVDLQFKFSSISGGVLKKSGDPNSGPGKNMHQNTEEEGTSNQSNFNIVDSNAAAPDSNQNNFESSSSHSSTSTKTLLLDEFHIFSWMNTHIEVPDSSKTVADSSAPNFKAGVREVLLQKDLQEIDDYLLQATSLSDQFAYKASPRHTRKQFYDVLAEVKSKVQADQSLETIYELQVELSNAAEALFGFFLSPQQSGPTIEKYWGPLYDIIIAMLPHGLIQLDKSSGNDNLQLNPAPHISSDRAWSLNMRDVRHISDWMKSIGRRKEEFKELVSEVPIVERCKIEFSDKLPRAWLHLLMALAYTKDMAPPWLTHTRVCLELMEDGMKETIQKLSNYQLSDYVVFTPFDVASLMTFQLSQDLTGSCPDICETYIDYMGSLDLDIDADPINREHQGRITDLKQEISIILKTLETQREILDDARNTQLRPNYQDGRSNRVVHASKYEYKPSPFAEPRIRNIMSYDKPIDYHNHYEFDLEIKTSSPPNNQWSPDNSRGMQGLLFRESLELIEERIEIFRNINDRATYLEGWNLRSIDTNKDRQEKAIYAFTIVTIIFLPLSTVASILGMNTNDVRNMELTQWLFWVIAIPLTLLIIGLVLIWSDEWYNFRSAFSNLWGKKTKRRHLRLPEDYARVEPMTGLSIAPKARASGIYPGYYPPPPGPVPRLRRSSTILAGREYAPGVY